MKKQTFYNIIITILYIIYICTKIYIYKYILICILTNFTDYIKY